MSDNTVSIKILNTNNISSNYHNWLNDKNINKCLESRFVTHTKISVQNFVQMCNKDKNIILNGIFVNDIHIGNIKININPYHKYADLGILIGNSQYHNKGYAKKSISLMLKIAKKNKLNKIFVGMYANNINSINLFKSLDFIKIGVFKRHYLVDDIYVDKVLMEYLL
jgi:RimJ/RimL family protein N-acetyltransferase